MPGQDFDQIAGITEYLIVFGTAIVSFKNKVNS